MNDKAVSIQRTVISREIAVSFASLKVLSSAYLNDQLNTFLFIIKETTQIIDGVLI